MGQGTLEAEVRVEQAADQDADEEGGIDLLRDEGQGNGDHRGQQGPGGVVEGAGGLDIARPLAAGAHTGATAVFAGRVLPVAGHADPLAAAVGADDHLAARLLRGVACGQARGAQGKNQDHQQTQQSQQPSLVVSHGSLSLKQKSHGRRHDFPREEPTTALRPARGDSP